jgi:hypothetical protein
LVIISSPGSRTRPGLVDSPRRARSTLSVASQQGEAVCSLPGWQGARAALSHAGCSARFGAGSSVTCPRAHPIQAAPARRGPCCDVHEHHPRRPQEDLRHAPHRCAAVRDPRSRGGRGDRPAPVVVTAVDGSEGIAGRPMANLILGWDFGATDGIQAARHRLLTANPAGR